MSSLTNEILCFVTRVDMWTTIISAFGDHVVWSGWGNTSC